MPIIAAASWSCAVARIALPWRVRCTSQTSRIKTGITESATIKLDQRYLLPPISKTTPVGRMLGTDTGAGPSRLSPTSWRMNDIPIAVISGARRGAVRRDAQGDPAPKHEHVTVREVDQLENPVDERVAERDQSVDEAER